MALQDSSSTPFVSSVLALLDDEVKDIAFRTGNPNLAAEVREISRNPRRVRKLTSEAAVEAIQWITDPDVIEAAVSYDSRVAVHTAANNRLHELTRKLSVAPNAQNILDRTLRAVKKPVPEAVAALVRCAAVDEPTVLSWMDSLSDEDQTTALAAFISEGRPFVINDHVERAVRLLEKSQSAASPLLRALESDFVTARAVVELFSGSYEAVSAEVVSFSTKYDLPPRPLSANNECATVWRASERWDLLCASGHLSVAEIPAVLSALQNPDCFESLRRLVSAVRTPEMVDAVVETADVLGMFQDNHRTSWGSEFEVLSEMLLVEGVSIKAATKLTTAFMTPQVASYVASPTAHPAALDALCRSHNASDIFYELRGVSRGEEEPELPELARALFEHSESLPLYMADLYRSWLRRPKLERAVMRHLSEILGTDEDAWTAFWTLSSATSTATMSELAQAAMALRS